MTTVKDNRFQNKLRKPYDYAVGHKALLKNAPTAEFGTDAYGGLCAITSVNTDNGTMQMKKGKVTDSFNIRRPITDAFSIHWFCTSHS